MDVAAEIHAETPAVIAIVIPMIRNVEEAEITTAITNVRITAREAVAAIPVQCPALGIIMIVVVIMITETLQDRISRESEEGRPAAAIISRIKYLFSSVKKSGSFDFEPDFYWLLRHYFFPEIIIEFIALFAKIAEGLQIVIF